MFKNKAFKIAQTSSFPIFTLFFSLFLAGLIAGQIVAGTVPQNSIAELRDYLMIFNELEMNDGFASDSFLTIFLFYFRYPMLAFLLDYASIGIVLLPCLTIAFGFFLSYSVCCFVLGYGLNGMFLSLIFFGLRCLITLPCYFFIAVPAWKRSLALASISFGKGRRIAIIQHEKIKWKPYLICIFVLILGGMVEVSLLPHFMRLVQTLI